MKPHPVIAISGPPGSGKSTFARALAAKLGAVIVDMDRYQTFTDEGIDQVVERLAEAESNDAFYQCFQVPQLDEDLKRLKRGEAVSLPQTATETSNAVQAQGPIIFETHFGRAHSATAPLIDFFVWLECPRDIAMVRKLGDFFDEFLQQDPRHHSQQMEWLNQYVRSYQSGVMTTLDIQAATLPIDADLILDATQPVDALVQESLAVWAKFTGTQTDRPTTSETASTEQESAREYLCVEPFVAEFIQVQVLKSSFECGLIEALEKSATALSESQLHNLCRTDEAGLRLLLHNLRQHGVVERHQSAYQLTAGFVKTLAYRDLLQAKIEFANFLAPDLLQNMDSFIADEAEFMASSKLFELFDYHRAMQPGADNYAFTQRWMNLTTALTRHEAGVCIAHHDFSDCQRVMDIGGNSGEFARQICAAHPQIHATVVDLPVVCEVGRDYLADSAQASAVEFYPANALLDPLPGQQCRVSFKSMLHDWPIEACERFILQASRTLRKGGELLIFERSALDWQRAPMTFGSLPTSMFYRSYRDAEAYRPLLEKAGLEAVCIEIIPLETDFHLITARKP